MDKYNIFNTVFEAFNDKILEENDIQSNNSDSVSTQDNIQPQAKQQPNSAATASPTTTISSATASPTTTTSSSTTTTLDDTKLQEIAKQQLQVLHDTLLKAGVTEVKMKQTIDSTIKAALKGGSDNQSQQLIASIKQAISPTSEQSTSSTTTSVNV